MARIIDVTVVGAHGLKDKELFTRQDPYVVVEYGNQRHRSKTDIDGGTNPGFNFSVQIHAIPGMDDLPIVIWNENTLRDNVIGSTRISLRQVIDHGFDDRNWPVYDSKLRQRGSIRVVLKAVTAPAAPYPHAASVPMGYPPASPYGAYPPPSASAYPPQPQSYAAPAPQAYGNSYSYPHAPHGYPPPYGHY